MFLASRFFWGEVPPNFWTWIIKFRQFPIMWRSFAAIDRVIWRTRGERKKKKTSLAFYKTSRTTVPDGLKTKRNVVKLTHNVVWVYSVSNCMPACHQTCRTCMAIRSSVFLGSHTSHIPPLGTHSLRKTVKDNPHKYAVFYIIYYFAVHYSFIHSFIHLLEDHSITTFSEIIRFRYSIN